MSLFKQSVVLTIARVVTVFVQLVTPIVLVRILLPREYGLYQEFIVYSMLAVSFIEFSINSNLIYFISKNPDKEKQYITNTTLMNFVVTCIGVAAIFIAKDSLLRLTAYDFVNVMIMFVVSYVNFNYLESYWIAKRQTTNILFYAAALAISRTAVIVLVAYYSGGVGNVLYALVILQTVKCALVALYLLRKRLLSWRIDMESLRAQLQFAIPLGVAAVILYFNNEVSKIIISSQLGVVALAMYAIGSKQIPITGIIRTSVADVIFPELVKRNLSDPTKGLHLWKRANVVYSFLLLPIFYTVFYYADVIIVTLFTDEYARAIPIFRIYLLLVLLRDTIEMGTPLRALNQNKLFVYGNVLSLAVNIATLYVLFKLYGFYGPAVALVVTTFALQAFLGTRIIKSYKISFKQLFMWRKQLTMTGVAICCLPILLLGELVPMNQLLGAIVFSVVYCVAYVVVLRWFRISEVDTIMSRILIRFKLVW